MNKTFKLIMPLALGLTVASCGETMSTQGYVFDIELANAIQPGIDNRQSVVETMGTPTLTAQFSDKTWYYISTNIEARPLYLVKAKARRVMSVTFDDKGVVDDVKNYDLSHARAINPVSEITPTRGKDLGFFKQLFMNVGRFSGQQNVGSPGGPGPNGS